MDERKRNIILWEAFRAHESKLVLRFYDDERGSIEKKLRHTNMFKQTYDECVEREYLCAQWYWWPLEWWAGVAKRHVSRMHERARAHLETLVKKRVVAILQGDEQLAIEQRDYSFRYVRDAERAEIRDAVAHAIEGTFLLIVFRSAELIQNPVDQITSLE